MDLNTILALSEAGVDTNGALRRFNNNSALYERFLNKFPSDPTFNNVTSAFDEKDKDAALTAAHTFKGLTSNLGLDPLFAISSSMVDLIRQDKFDEAAKSYPALKDEYDKICNILLRE